MPKEIKVMVYSYKELDQKAKLKVREWFKNNGNYPEDDWYTAIIEDQTERLEELGYEDIDICFSGFYSQGDGASFTGKVNLEKWIEKNQPDSNLLPIVKNSMLWLDDNRIVRDRHHGYYHEKTTTVHTSFSYSTEFTGVVEDALLKQIDSLDEDILKQHREINRKIYSQLEKEYDRLHSDEVVEELIIENKYQFLEDGRLFLS